ncbi:MAG: CDP-glycerol glycerophosphotransferase family protein [Lachnospiraceae bacterium]|nr:CDP-glycerol glycerophosphotransferase family protein [Lachnospiraceae bacterium]
MLGNMLLYIDPGTGGMLFTILIGLMGGVIYFFSTLFVKLKYSVGGRNKGKQDTKKIPLVFFSDHKRYWNIYEPILDELEKRGVEATFLTMSEDDPFFTKEYKHITGEFIGTGNKAFSRLGLLNAGIVFSSTPGLDVLQWKRSRKVDYYIHIPHASSDITLYRMFGIDYFDAILLSGDYQIEQIRELERLRNLPAKELELVGIPYMDTMKERLDSAENADSSASTVDSDGASVEKRRTILVAPSWGESGLLKKYGEKLIDELLKTGYRIIIRPHPQSFTAEKDLMDRLMKQYENTDLEWNRDNDNFEVLRSADLMISDFSGVIFDFSLVFDKPFLYAESHMDKSPYDCAWIEKELWVYDVLPRIGTKLREEDFGDIKRVIDECIDNPKGKENRDQARRETWAYIGHGREHVVDYILRKQRELTNASGNTTGDLPGTVLPEGAS